MWSKKEDEAKPVETTPRTSSEPLRPAAEPNRAAPPISRGGTMETVVKIGKSINIRGELTGNEDLTIEGTVDGKIELREHNLVVGSTGKIQAEMHAKTVTIQGEVNGNIRAEDRIEISTSGTVKGDLVAPRIIIADGARFKGSVDMDKPGGGDHRGVTRPTTTSAPTVTSDSRPTVVSVSAADKPTVKV